VTRLVYYSVVHSPSAPRSDLFDQLLGSVRSLRRYNRSVPVVVFVHGDAPAGLARALATHGVQLVAQEPYEARLARLCPSGWPVLRHYPLLHKFLNFVEIASIGPRQALFLDCDTLFFADVDRLFDAYDGAHCYAREEPTCRRSHYGYDPSYLDEDALSRVAWSQGVRPPPPFNLGVVLFNHGIWDTLAALDQTVVSYAWRLLVWLALHPSGDRAARYGEGDAVRLLRPQLHHLAPTGELQAALPYPSANEWILDQVALWLALAHVPDLIYGDFAAQHVVQNGEFLARAAPEPEWVLCHYFSQNTGRLQQWSGGSTSAVHP
jgi:hypothetical protein